MEKAAVESRPLVVTWEHPKTGPLCMTICDLTDGQSTEADLPLFLAVARLDSVHDADDIVIRGVRRLR